MTRVRELAPDNLPARLWLGQIYVLSRLPDRALEALRDPVEHPEKFSLAETNLTQLNILARRRLFSESTTWRGAPNCSKPKSPAILTDDDLRTAAVQVYVSAWSVHQCPRASLTANSGWRPTTRPGFSAKATSCIQLKDYDDAIAALTRVLAIQTNNDDALFNRAIAYLDSGQLDAARADYKTLAAIATPTRSRSPTASAKSPGASTTPTRPIRNYKLYLANANTNTAEATNIILNGCRELKWPIHPEPRRCASPTSSPGWSSAARRKTPSPPSSACARNPASKSI